MWLDLKPISHPMPVLQAKAAAPRPKFETDAVKRCARCNAHHPVANFTIDAAKPDGLASYCKPCKREVQQASRDRMAERMEAWRKSRMKP
jgi:hypothetical protein